MAAAPIVTGISPKEGPPGTRVTIRGENLGRSPQDLIGLTICGVDCLLSAEWQASNKIVARSGPVKGRGDVIVTTKHGGRGACTIQFRSFFESIGPLKETAFWVDESHLISSIWGRKHQSVPSQFQPDNPLCLNDEENVKKFSEEELHDYFSDGSGNLSLDNFVPTWFLVENHHNASFNDLKAGVNHLKRKVSMQKEGKLSFLKANIGAVLDQLDTLAVLQTNILRDKTGSASGTLLSTVKIEQAICRSKAEADCLFKDVLGRRDRADATRNALGVLQRFKILFHLPCTIERNIQKGDYDIVINDYSRAKSLFGNTEVQIFQKVFQEVEQRISAFSEMLYSRLKDLPAPVEKQKKLISYLVNLEVAGDPGWDCIVFQHQYIIEIVLNCRKSYIDQENVVVQNITQSTPLKGSGKSNFLSPVSLLKGNKDRRDSNCGHGDLRQDRPPHRVMFLEELCSLTIEEFSNLWKLGQAYISGEFHLKEVAPDRKHDFEQLVGNIMLVFCEVVCDALPLTTANVSGLSKRLLESKVLEKEYEHNWSDVTKDIAKLWLPHSIQQIRHFYSALIQLDIDRDVLASIKNLLFSMQISCVNSMFTRAQEEVRNLYLRETWIINALPEYGSITQLPFIYENSVLKTIQLVRESILQVGPHETELLGNVTAEKEILALWRELLLAFPQSLKQLAKQISPAEKNTSIPLATSPDTSKTGGKLRTNDCIDNESGQESMLLVILGNCTFTERNILPRLLDSFQKHGYPNDESVGKEVLCNFGQLNQFLFDSYMELKCDPVVGAIEQGIYAGHFEWFTCPRVLGVRPYIKEILTGIVVVHAEVNSLLPSILLRAVQHMIQAVSEEISRLFSCVDRFGHNGGLQACIDLTALSVAFGLVSGEESSSVLKETLSSLPRIKTNIDAKFVEDELNTFKRRMKYHLMCFKLEDIPA